MEKISKPIEVRLPPLDIYADDIKKIYELIKETYENIELKVITKNEVYRLEDVDEIKQLKDFQNIRGLYIQGYNKSALYPEVTISLYKSPLLITSIDSYNSYDYASRGIIDAVREMFLQRKNKLRTLLTSRLFWYPIILLALFNRFIIPEGWKLSVISYPLINFATLGVYFTASFLIPHVLIFGVQKNELPSYWKRQKDHLITASIAAVIGAAIGALITYYLTRQ